MSHSYCLMYPIDFEVLDSADTPIGTIYLSTRKLSAEPSSDIVHEVHINGHLLMSSVSPVSEKHLSTSALALHTGRDKLRVLVGGLGLGYTAQAALADERVASVRVVDKMDFVIGWMRKGTLPCSAELTTDPRVELVQGDVYADLLSPPRETFDLILIDVDHAPTDPLDPASLPFYTPEGQRMVAQHLAPGGVLGVWSAYDDDDFHAVMQQVYPGATREDVRWERVEQVDPPRPPFHNVLFFGQRQG
jgi:spermidine synthase